MRAALQTAHDATVLAVLLDRHDEQVTDAAEHLQDGVERAEAADDAGKLLRDDVVTPLLLTVEEELLPAQQPAHSQKTEVRMCVCSTNVVEGREIVTPNN